MPPSGTLSAIATHGPAPVVSYARSTALTSALCHWIFCAVPYRHCSPPTGDASSSTSVSIPTPYSGTCQLGALYPLLSSVSAPVYVALALGQNVTPTVSLCPTGTVSTTDIRSVYCSFSQAC